jgi:hypothetical protein
VVKSGQLWQNRKDPLPLWKVHRVSKKLVFYHGDNGKEVECPRPLFLEQFQLVERVSEKFEM